MKRLILLKDLTNLEALPVSAVLLDPSGTIVGVNNAWKEFGRRNGLCLRNSGIGASYLTHCGAGRAGSGVAKDLRELLAGRRDLVMHVYPCNSPGEERWFMMLAFPLSLSGPSGIAILHAEISSFVPLPVVEKQGKRRAGQKGGADPSSIFAELAGTVEASVSLTLASQLQSMLKPPAAKRSKPKAQASEDKNAIDTFPRARLSKRQLEVLRLLGEGKTNAQIAKALFRSPHTIKLHVSAILRELNLKSRTQAALLASKLPKGS